MNKIDYNKLMEEEISKFSKKPKLLLHACCAPCSSSVLERLNKFFNVTVFFYNPNMDTEEEFSKRDLELINLISCLNKKYDNKIEIVSMPYKHSEFLNFVFGLENENEGGARCEKCFYLRLNKTAEYAKKNKFDYFTTTLSVSPYKNSEVLNKVGENIEEKYDIKYLYSDFKKKEGYKRSIELSKEYKLYRQDYCGCEFSKNNRNKVDTEN